ncbi:hypothetical protein BsWGS_00048 [Bradybaena similaris]
MQPSLICSSSIPKTKGHSWSLGLNWASLILRLGAIALLIWHYGPSFVSAQSSTSTSNEDVAVPLGYLHLFAIGAAAFIMVTILHVFFKLPFMTPCVDSPQSCSPQKTGSEDTDSPVVHIDTGDSEDEEIISYLGDTVDTHSDPCTHLFDVATATEDPADHSPTTDDDTMNPEYERGELVEFWAGPERARRQDQPVAFNVQIMPRTSRPLPATDIDLPGAGEPEHTSLVCKRSVATQTDVLPRPQTKTVGTMTCVPQLADASVGCQNSYKLVKSSNTTTSGLFMKKLRRAQRLLKEARVKLRTERHSKLVMWAEVLGRYKDRLQCLTQSLEKKDVLLSYTALNRALSENELKDMCTAVSSARDRLLTQCKLNSALKEVVASKCDTVSSATSSQTSTSQS